MKNFFYGNIFFQIGENKVKHREGKQLVTGSKNGLYMTLKTYLYHGQTSRPGSSLRKAPVIPDTGRKHKSFLGL